MLAGELSPHQGVEAAGSTGPAPSLERDASGGADSAAVAADGAAATGTAPAAHSLSRMPSLKEIGDAEFASPGSIPAPEHKADTSGVTAAADTVEEEEVPDYLAQFQGAVASEEVVVGMVGEDELRERESAIEMERLQLDAEDADRFAERELRLSAAEAAAKRRVWQAQQAMAETLRKRDDYFADQAHKRETAIHRAFRRAETSLRERLQQQQGVVQERYGDLLPDLAHGSGTRELRVEWRGLPQPVQMEVTKVRAIKNKLPTGRYVLLATLYDRLGGAPMRWSKVGKTGGLASAGLSGATKAVRHWGRFFDTELRFNQKLYAMLPPPTQIRPSNVIIFELFLLGGKRSPVDRVVAWSALPATDADFRPIEGKFRLPLLRGELNLNVDMYSKLELTIGDDLDNWLGNLYIDVSHLPRTAVVDGTTVREYDTHISYTSEMLGLSASRAKRLAKRRGSVVDAEDDAVGAGSDKPISERAGLLGDDPGVDDDFSDDSDGFDSASDVDGEAEDVAVGAARVMTHRDHRSKYTKARPSAYSSQVAAPLKKRLAPGTRGSAYSSTLVGASGGGGAMHPSSAYASTLGGGTGTRASAYSSTLTPGSDASGRKSGTGSAYTSVFSGGGGGGGGGAYASSFGRPSAAAAGGAYTSTLAAGGASPGLPRKRNPYASTEMGAAGGSHAPRLARLLAGGNAAPSALSVAAAADGKGVRFAGAYAQQRAKARNLVSDASRIGDEESGTARSSVAGILGAVPGVVRGASSGVSRRKATDQAMETEQKKLHTFMYAVTRQENKGVKGRRLPDSARKVRFMSEELFADLAFPSFTNVQFWIQLAVLLLAMYFRIYIHYLGQWLLLRALRVPVYQFAPTGYNVLLKYVPGVLPFEYEMGVVIMGPLTNAFALGLFIFAAWLCLLLVRHIPEMYSRFVAFYGLATCLDPFLIFVVDAIAGFFFCSERASCRGDISATSCVCHEGDAWKLYNRFLADEGSGVAGVILTVFLYLVLFMVAAFFTYLFLLNMHMDGRMLDVYRRLNAHESAFLVPHDMEVSLAELKDVAAKTARWRGTRGRSRKIAVCDYILTDPLDEDFREVTTHIIIYEAGLDGSRELYRHFLRLPDGAIIEVFGDMSKQFGVGTSALQEVLLQHGASDDEATSFFSGLA